jgi:agmatinase
MPSDDPTDPTAAPVARSAPIGPTDASKIPRFAGLTTFARLPRIDQVPYADVALLGVPFDSGVTYRPGARFGPSAIREASRLIRPYNPALDVSPFQQMQVVDAGDVAANPFDIAEALQAIDDAATALGAAGTSVVALGGDHTIALPLLRAVHRLHGPVALLHFDAHLDTWDTYFGADYTHGTPFRRAAEEGLLDTTALSHIGIRGPLYGRNDLTADEALGFGIVTCGDLSRRGVDAVITQMRDRIGDRPLYISVDVDVMDPAHAPGTGTPEAGGLSSREMLELLRGLDGLNVIGADVVEVAPAYDHADITAIAAAAVAYECVCLMARHRARSAA